MLRVAIASTVTARLLTYRRQQKTVAQPGCANTSDFGQVRQLKDWAREFVNIIVRLIPSSAIINKNKMLEKQFATPINSSYRCDKFIHGNEEFKRTKIRTDDNGVLLAAFLAVPERINRETFSAIILVHGFAAEKTENGLFSITASELKKQGYFVLSYDWRGLGESEGTFSDSDLKQHADDFRRVVQWLVEETGIPSSKVCAVGFSLGAAVVAISLKKNVKLGGAAFWSPAVRPSVTMWPRYNTPQFKKQLKATGFIEKPENNVRIGRKILDSLRLTDLGDSAFNLGIPLMVCHGTDDARIPFKTSLEVFKRSPRADILFIEFCGASHSFRPDEQYRSHLIQRFSQWLSDDGLRQGKRQLTYSPEGSASDQRSNPPPHTPAQRP